MLALISPLDCDLRLQPQITTQTKGDRRGPAITVTYRRINDVPIGGRSTGQDMRLVGGGGLGFDLALALWPWQSGLCTLT